MVCGAEDGLVAVLGAQDVVVEPRQDLHGDVLERQAGAVEQLGHEGAGRELLQRHDRRMAEGRVGLAAHAGEHFGGDLVAGEGADHGGGDLVVRPAGEGGDLPGAELRPRLRHVEAAVGRQPRQDRIHKSDRRRLPAGRDVTHQPLSLLASMAA
jgi:hypothetical protein